MVSNHKDKMLSVRTLPFFENNRMARKKDKTNPIFKTNDKVIYILYTYKSNGFLIETKATFG